MAKATPSVTNEWEHTLALGVTATSGNSDTKLGTASWLSEFMSLGGNLTRFSADGQNGESDGKKSADNAKGNINHKHLLGERTYAVGDVAALYDSVADINYRVTVSPGLGYYLMKNDAATLSTDIGPAYVWEKLGGVENDYAALRVAQRYERKLGTNAKVWQSAEYLPQIDDFDKYIVSGELGVEAPLTAAINLRLVFKDQYDNIPAAGRERNDTQIVGAVALKL